MRSRATLAGRTVRGGPNRSGHQQTPWVVWPTPSTTKFSCGGASSLLDDANSWGVGGAEAEALAQRPAKDIPDTPGAGLAPHTRQQRVQLRLASCRRRSGSSTARRASCFPLGRRNLPTSTSRDVFAGPRPAAPEGAAFRRVPLPIGRRPDNQPPYPRVSRPAESADNRLVRTAPPPAQTRSEDFARRLGRTIGAGIGSARSFHDATRRPGRLAIGPT